VLKVLKDRTSILAYTQQKTLQIVPAAQEVILDCKVLSACLHYQSGEKKANARSVKFLSPESFWQLLKAFFSVLNIPSLQKLYILL